MLPTSAPLFANIIICFIFLSPNHLKYHLYKRRFGGGSSGSAGGRHFHSCHCQKPSIPRVLATWWQWWSYLPTSYTQSIIFVILPLCIYSFSKFSLEVESTATTATKHQKPLHCGHFSSGSSYFTATSTATKRRELPLCKEFGTLISIGLCILFFCLRC